MNIYRSLEVRWFSSVPVAEPQRWFKSHGLALKGNWDRSDRYLLNRSSLFSVKLREGRLEVKIRTGTSALSGQEFKADFWQKWSYALKDEGTFLGDQIDIREYADVSKERLLLYTSTENPVFTETTNASSACQIEYSRILLKDKEYYSFGMEAFGPDEPKMKAELENAIQLLSEAGSIPLSGTSEIMDYPDILAPLL